MTAGLEGDVPSGPMRHCALHARRTLGTKFAKEFEKDLECDMIIEAM